MYFVVVRLPGKPDQCVWNYIWGTGRPCLKNISLFTSWLLKLPCPCSHLHQVPRFLPGVKNSNCWGSRLIILWMKWAECGLGAWKPAWKLAPGDGGGQGRGGAAWFMGLLPGWNVKIATDEGLLFSHTSAEHLELRNLVQTWHFTYEWNLTQRSQGWVPDQPQVRVVGWGPGLADRDGSITIAPQSNLKWSSMLAPFYGWCYLLKLSVGKDQNDLLTTQSFYSQWSKYARSAWEARVRQVQYCWHYSSVQPLPFESLLGLEVDVLSTWWSERRRRIMK